MRNVFEVAGVLFDNDGVLVDSRAVGDAVWTQWALRRGLDPADVLEGIHGRRSRETVARFVAAADIDAATAEIDALELARAGETRAIAGAAALVAQLPDEARALVTSAPRALGEARLRGAGVPVPATIVASEDVVRGKPDPEPYALAAARLNHDPSDCLVFEDSDNGIAAARAAKVKFVIGVGAAARGEDCDAYVDDLTGIRWTGAAIELP